MPPKLDLYDRKILYELDHDARQPNKQIAKKVGLSEQVVGNRIKRLLDNKIIDYFYVKINPTVIGHFHVKIFLRLHNLAQEKFGQLLQELRSQPNILWLVSLRGKYDLTVSIYIKNVAEFSTAYQKLFGSWQDYILDRKILFLEKASTYNQSHLWPKQPHLETVYTKGSEEKISLDETDTKILRLLNLNGRETLVQMAKQLGISADTVNYRIKNLEKAGLIIGFGVKINSQKMGNSYSVLCLKMQNMTPEKYAKLETWAKFNPQVITLIKTLGDHEIEIEFITQNKEELDSSLKSLRDEFVTEIKDYELLEVTDEVRISYFPF